MSKEKQIEEMANDLYENRPYKDLWLEDAEDIANILYNAGYRKQSEGEWKYPPYAPSGGSYEMRRCSVCGYKPDFDSDNPYTKFCPNCGAKMKGGE